MKNQILYEKKGLVNKVRIHLENETIVYEEHNWGNSEHIKFHSSKLSELTSFSRVYHLGLITTSIFLGFLSIKLLIAKWSTTEWTFYLALVPIICIALGYLYYFLIGIKYGEVKLNIDNSRRHLYMTKENFNQLKSNIENIPKY